MKQSYKIVFGLLFIFGAVSCTKGGVSDIAREDSFNYERQYRIPVDEALSSLNSFLESEGLSTKASDILNGDYSISEWEYGTETKSNTGISNRAVYCVEFSKGKGSAVLAADSRISDRIICVNESSCISAKQLEIARNQLHAMSITQNNLVATNIEKVPLGKVDESFVAKEVCRYLLIDNKVDDQHRQKKDPVPQEPQTIKYGPLIETKWGPKAPFNNMMNGAKVGCVPIATAQLVFYDCLQKNIDSLICAYRVCFIDTLKTICYYPNYNNIDSDEANTQMAYFILDIKQKCGMNITDESGFVWNVEKGLTAYGFKNVEHTFAHFGGDEHDINHLNELIDMLAKGNPVIMLAFSISDLCGHAFIIDGYKKDNTGEFFHINWGWNGIEDGYFAKGCFDESERIETERGFDLNPGHDPNPSNFNTCHYYVHYK